MNMDIQHKAYVFGKSGCYTASEMYWAEQETGMAINVMDAVIGGMARGDITGDCFMEKADSFFSWLTGAAWDVLKAGPGHELPLEYCPKAGEYEILRFERPNPEGGEPLAHFVAGDGTGRVKWDPWEESRTVAEGKLVSKRILRKREATA